MSTTPGPLAVFWVALLSALPPGPAPHPALPLDDRAAAAEWLRRGLELERGAPGPRAMFCVRKALALDPTQPVHHVALFDALLRRGRLEEAADVGFRFARTFPRHAERARVVAAVVDALLRSAAEHRASSRWEGVAMALRRALALDPAGPRAVAISGDLVQVDVHLAGMYERSRQIVAQARTLADLARLRPADPRAQDGFDARAAPSLRRAPDVFLEAARRQLDGGRPQEARRLLEMYQKDVGGPWTKALDELWSKTAREDGEKGEE